VRNEEELHRVKERNILQTIQGRKPNWIDNILHRNCLLKHASEGKKGKNVQDETIRKKTYVATG
jgi:hypothetical protein